MCFELATNRIFNILQNVAKTTQQQSMRDEDSGVQCNEQFATQIKTANRVQSNQE